MLAPPQCLVGRFRLKMWRLHWSRSSLTMTLQIPAVLRRLEIPDFKISRTYCISAKPCAYSYLGVAIYNHAYSSKPCNVRPYPSEVKETPGPAAWRRGCGTRCQSQWQGGNYIDPQASCPASSFARAQATAAWSCYWQISARVEKMLDLGGGFTDFLYSSLLGGRFPFWRAYFSNGDKNHQLVDSLIILRPNGWVKKW